MQALPAFVESRRIGQATVTIISEGSLLWAPEFQVADAEWRRALPEATARGEIWLGINVAHVQIDDASLLIDPGFDDPTAQRAEPSAWPDLTRSPGLAAGLASIGVRPEQITHVLITHTHDDHFAGVTVERDGERVARFPRARHLVGRRDWDDNPNRTQPGSALTIHLGTLERLRLLEVVDRECEVVPGVTLIPTPGESPGHAMARVHSVGESFYYVGDLFHHPCEVEHLDWVSPGRDRAAVRASRERLIAAAVAERAIVVFTHARFPAWGHIRPAGAGYRWERA